MATLEEFDNEIKELVNSSKLSSSKIKVVTDAAMANISSDGHIVATMFKVHKQAKSTHKISSLYVIDAIAREARQQVKKASKGKQSTSNSTTPLHDGQSGSEPGVGDDDAYIGRKGTYASFLTKIESFLERLVVEVLTKGPPEHKEKVKKVLDIWKKSSTFSSDALKACYSRLEGDTTTTDVKPKKTQFNRTTTSASGQRSTTPPYPPPDVPARFPPLSALPRLGTPPAQPAQPPLPNADIAALLSNISAAQQQQPALLNFPPPPQQAAPAFELSQLALLQQLAAQTNGSGNSAASSIAPSGVGPSIMPNIPMPPPSIMPTAPPAASTSTSYPSESPFASGGPSQQWQPQPPNQIHPSRQRSPPRDSRDRSSRWDMDDRVDRDRNRRSRSPVADRPRYARDRSHSPSRRRSPPPRNNNDRPGYNSRQDQARNDQPRSTSGNYGENTRKGRDLNDFNTGSQNNSGAPHANSQAQQDDSASGSKNTPQIQQQSFGGATSQPDLLSNAAPFNPATFNALEPASWASFAVMCSANMGRMPSNMEMVQWIMSCMTMLQAAAASQMGGSNNASGNFDMQNFMGMGMGTQGNMNGGNGGMDFNQNNSNQQDSWDGDFDGQRS